MTKADPGAEGESAALPTHGLPSGPVEARSLSGITAIASNPPAYPRNPTQKKLEPLVLYIVRVPGSRDVFLSPLKPPTKASVSAEAINASLYYLHVAGPDDEALLQECEQEREEAAQLRKEQFESDVDVPLEFARMNQVRRKPVPGGLAGGAPPAPPVAVAGELDLSSPPPLPVRPPKIPLDEEDCPPPMPPRPNFSQRCTWDSISTEPNQPGNATPPRGAPRRPLPPVPRDEAFEQPPDAFTQKKANRWSALSGYISSRGLEGLKDKYESSRHSLDAREPRMRPHSSGGVSAHAAPRSPGRSPGQSPTRKPHDSRPQERPGFHITLIRRDPTHGHQWNVATMSTPRMDGSAIDIDISTPGYNRFIGKEEPLSFASLGLNLPSNGQPVSLPSLPAEISQLSQPTDTSSAPQPRRFTRKLCVSRPYQNPDEARSSLDAQGGPTRASIDSAGSNQQPSLSKLKSGYYTFTSPWNGTCTFSTSVNGRSLKCKHMIPMPGFSNTNEIDNPAITAAEIRFNTPFQAGHLHHQPSPSHVSPFTLSQTPAFSGAIDPSTPYTGGPNPYLPPPQPTQESSFPRGSKRASFAQFLNPNTYAHGHAQRPSSASSNSYSGFPTGPPNPTPGHGFLHRNPSTSSTSSADMDPRKIRAAHRRAASEDRLDLSLARERAGGGMRGKSAKLGKLVIEDEGIKMLDLVVAACMAVWWRGYYY